MGHMYDPNKTLNERMAEALERIADALERAHPPRPAPAPPMERCDECCCYGGSHMVSCSRLPPEFRVEAELAALSRI